MAYIHTIDAGMFLFDCFTSCPVSFFELAAQAQCAKDDYTPQSGCCACMCKSRASDCSSSSSIYWHSDLVTCVGVHNTKAINTLAHASRWAVCMHT